MNKNKTRKRNISRGKGGWGQPREEEKSKLMEKRRKKKVRKGKEYDQTDRRSIIYFVFIHVQNAELFN